MKRPPPYNPEYWRAIKAQAAVDTGNPEPGSEQPNSDDEYLTPH